MKFVVEGSPEVPECKVKVRQTSCGVRVEIGNYYLFEFINGNRRVRIARGVDGSKVGLDTDDSGRVLMDKES